MKSGMFRQGEGSPKLQDARYDRHCFITNGNSGLHLCATAYLASSAVCRRSIGYSVQVRSRFAWVRHECCSYIVAAALHASNMQKMIASCRFIIWL